MTLEKLRTVEERQSTATPSNQQQGLSANDLDYMDDLSGAVLEQSPHHTRLMIWVICGFIFLLIIWAAWAQLDEITKGEGKVIPSRQIQIVQNLEGGIIDKFFVAEGQLVEKGEILLRIDDTRFSSSYKENRLSFLELLAKSSRLEAEANGQNDFSVPAAVMDDQPQLGRFEEELFTSRLQQLQSNVGIYDEQILQNRQELTEARSKTAQLEASYKLSKRELDIITPLAEQGAVSEVELIRLERQVLELKGELDGIKLSIPRLKAKIKESENKRQEQYLRFQSEARQELNEVVAELSRLRESGSALEDQVSRTSVRSPVKGKIKQLLVNTEGGVVQPGMDLIEIVPIDDALLIEAKIRPADIAYLHPGQRAIVKFTAYDFAIHGGLEAEVVHISADTITDEEEKDQSFYLVRVKTKQNYLGSEDKALPIIPGMTTQVDIITGKKTVLDYLLKPIFKAKQEAMTER